jgi:hypothetical protein
VEDHRCKQKADTLCTSIDCSRQASCLTRQVEVEIQLEKMVVNTARHPSDSLLSDTGKDRIANFLEKGRAYSCCAVCLIVREGIGNRVSRQHTSNDHCTSHSPSSASHGKKVYVHRVNDALEVERHLDIKQFCANEQTDGEANAHSGSETVLRIVLAPDGGNG